MALKKCKECGNKISTTAAACPKCGARIEVALPPDKGDPKRGRRWLYVIGALILVGSIPGVLLNLSGSPSNSAGGAGTTAAGNTDPAAAKTAYLKKVDLFIDAMGSMKIEATGLSMGTMNASIEIFNAGAQLVKESNNYSLDPTERARVKHLADETVQRQRQAFPVMRQKYGPLMAKALWKADIEASTLGTRYSTIQLVGGTFAAHANIADGEAAIYPSLMRLRFKHAWYKWIPSAEDYTTYAIDSPADEALAVISDAGTVTEVATPK